MSSRNRYLEYIKKGINQTGEIFLHELKTIFTDSGVLLIMVIAAIGYPLLYNYVYLNETLRDIPVASVDNSCTSESRRLLQKIEATPEVELVNCVNMDEAQRLFVNRKVHAIVMIPNDYADKLAHNEQTFFSLYANMSCFMVYKSVALAVNSVMLEEGKDIQLKRYAQNNTVGEQGLQMVKALPYEDTILYNSSNGFSSFFVPGILMIIVHQLMFLGICMLAGTAREENAYGKLFPQFKRGRGIYRVVFGKSLAYFILYAFLSVYIVVLMPVFFNLPHIGNVFNVFALLFPYLLAVIFFSMTASILVKNRETGMVMFLFFSVVLVFLAGISWPATNFPKFWKYFAYIFPATFGVRGYIKINATAATLGQVSFEYWGLWIQTVFYFLTACGATYWAFIRESMNIKRSGIE